VVSAIMRTSRRYFVAVFKSVHRYSAPQPKEVETTFVQNNPIPYSGMLIIG